MFECCYVFVCFVCGVLCDAVGIVLCARACVIFDVFVRFD